MDFLPTIATHNFNISFIIPGQEDTEILSVTTYSCEYNLVKKEMTLSLYATENENFLPNLIALIKNTSTIVLSLNKPDGTVANSITFVKCKCENHKSVSGYGIYNKNNVYSASPVMHELDIKYTTFL